MLYTLPRTNSLVTKGIVFSFLILSSFGTVSVKAQTTTFSESPEIKLFSSKKINPEGTVNCFDYYTFGSVHVDASPVASPITAGTMTTFKGVIKNTNPYPVVDGQVYVKIFKKDQPNEQLLRLNGYPIVDFFIAKDNVSVAGNKEQDITFDWTAPKGAQGEYQAAFFFTSAHRYNLLGLSFTDDITGGKSNFSIVSTSTADSPIVFDKNSLFLNKNTYHPVTFLQHFTKEEPVTVYATIKNENSTEKTIEVTWTTSKWDGILSSNEAKKETVMFTLAPKETKKISYTPPILTTSVTFVQGEVKDVDAKSLISVRFVRDGFNEIRTNFPGIMSYPLEGGKETTLFSCLHSTNAPLVEGGSLTLTLQDTVGTVLHTYTYTGGITGAMMGVKDVFTPKESLSTFSLTATLKQGGSVIEEVIMKYDCSQIDKALCLPSKTISGSTDNKNNTVYISIAVLIALLGIGGGVWVFIKKRKSGTVIPDTAPKKESTSSDQ